MTPHRADAQPVAATSVHHPHQVPSAYGVAAWVTGRGAINGLAGEVVDLDGGVFHCEEAGPFDAAMCLWWRLVDNGGRVQRAQWHCVAISAAKVQDAQLGQSTTGPQHSCAQLFYGDEHLFVAIIQEWRLCSPIC